MSKTDDLLNAFKQNLNQWTCSYCGSNSNQPAAIFREVKKLGYAFEEVAPNRWARELYCEKCGINRTHYKLLKPEPEFSAKQRITITPASRKHIVELLDGKDAFTGASISSTIEIDHKTPWTRLEHDVDASVLSDTEVKRYFQLLTREHNLLKDRMCDKCKKTGVRPPFLGIHFWYDGNQTYNGSCKGCGWYDGEKWRKEIDKYFQNE